MGFLPTKMGKYLDTIPELFLKKINIFLNKYRLISF